MEMWKKFKDWFNSISTASKVAVILGFPLLLCIGIIVFLYTRMQEKIGFSKGDWEDFIKIVGNKEQTDVLPNTPKLDKTLKSINKEISKKKK